METPWAGSSDGRAGAPQASGREFDPRPVPISARADTICSVRRTRGGDGTDQLSPEGPARTRVPQGGEGNAVAWLNRGTRAVRGKALQPRAVGVPGSLRRQGRNGAGPADRTDFTRWQHRAPREPCRRGPRFWAAYPGVTERGARGLAAPENRRRRSTQRQQVPDGQLGTWEPPGWQRRGSSTLPVGSPSKEQATPMSPVPSSPGGRPASQAVSRRLWKAAPADHWTVHDATSPAPRQTCDSGGRRALRLAPGP